ncbi:glutamate-1-semialdehyde 2,1-aminomutase [Methyloceanibacter caenitepidi]|uniref:Glutamate-1-semialdehyde aminotransferase n=1 Tax=Methyloceanibacter caenitepidi TaxID=1384459 RepID=A0A0A8JZB7_9HYPH|nr:glutamate-1-semialdehyde 2,1-aminomutase [Methyloceanibacter caenitepidi]BAQ15687.1 glutamate-1-semialdehyde aminotransferase [Methyloceanibacter caenitepidi]
MSKPNKPVQPLDPMRFDRSNALNARLRHLIPGGSHTYAKGEDQFPEHMAPVIVRGSGSHVWDADGNEFIEYGSGLRAVTLGHGYPAVISAAREQLPLGSNFIRPAEIELQCAEQFLRLIRTADMVKFCKDGSHAVSGAVRLARAVTGRKLVAICGDQPFFSTDDWFIGTTPLHNGIPSETRALVRKFHYNDLESLSALFDAYPDQIAAVILEAEKETPPTEEFLPGIRALCDRHGAVLVLDEMITGFRWDNGGAQAFHKIQPDLSCFGKGLGNGFSVSALAGKRELMRRGGIDHDLERVFLLSTTHGGETHALAAAMATMRTFETEPVVETLWARGARLKEGLQQAAAAHGLSEQVPILGRPCCLVFGSRDRDGQPSQLFRTLMLQELLKRGILASSLVVNYSHTEADIDRTVEAFDEAFVTYRRALEDGIERHLAGRPVKPVFRPYA